MISEVFLICGPPGAGKTTYVREHMKPGDIVWDFDAVLQAITGLPMHERTPAAHQFVMAMQDSFLRVIARTNARVWIIECAPSREHRARRVRHFGAQVIHLDVPAEICKQRVAARGEHWPAAVDRYFEDYEPHG